MILGTSHISISSFNIQKDIEVFQKSGFSLSFLDENIENNPQKKLYLNKYSPLHSIAVLSGKSGIDVELVQHHKKESDTQNKNINAVINNGFVNQIEYIVGNLDESVSFWQDFMGFTTVNSGDYYHILEKRSVFPKWSCKLKLAQIDKEIADPKLDNKGATSFAFFTANLKKEIDIFQQKYDSDCTNIFQISVNRKDLDIALLSGPSREIVELIQIKNEQKNS